MGILYDMVASEFVFVNKLFLGALVGYWQPLDLLKQPSVMENDYIGIKIKMDHCGLVIRW